MKVKASFLALLGLLISVSPLAAAPAKAFTPSSLERFLKDLPALMEELENLGEEFSEEFEGIFGTGEEQGSFDPSFVAAALAGVTANARVQAVLRKYKWATEFLPMYSALIYGYTYLIFEEIYAVYPLADYKTYLAQMKELVHPDDIALIKQNRELVESVLNGGDE